MAKHQLVLTRKTDNGVTTIGQLHLDGRFLCHTCEDTRRYYEAPKSDPRYEPKVYGKTCIASGIYPLIDRRHGGFWMRYTKRFRSIGHKGMIEIIDVPQFGDVLIHCGNTAENSHGCLLLGRQHNANFIAASSATYKRVYQIIYPLVKRGVIDLKIIDIDGQCNSNNPQTV